MQNFLYNLNLRNLSICDLRNLTLEHVTRLLTLLFIDNIESIYLVGSQVDESYSEISDIDLLMILRKKNNKIGELIYLLSFLTPVVVDIKVINKDAITSGKSIIDPCINYKRKILLGHEDTSLFKYTIKQYNDLNFGKIIQTLEEFRIKDKRDFVLDKTRFENMSVKKFLSLTSRLGRLTLGIKFNIVTYTKEQTMSEFKANAHTDLSRFLEQVHKMNNHEKPNSSDFLKYYGAINLEVKGILPDISFS